jgi:hypothetical protein
MKGRYYFYINKEYLFKNGNLGVEKYKNQNEKFLEDFLSRFLLPENLELNNRSKD